jgi:PEP-CTERM motif
MSRKLLLFMTAAIAAIQVEPAQAGIIGFGDFSNFTLNKSDSGSPSTISPGQIALTNGGNSETRSIFDDTPQAVSQFTASFTYQTTGAGGVNASNGVAFVVQNSAQGAHAIGAGAGGFGSNSLGYGGLPSSAAISLYQDFSVGSTGLFTGGNLGGVGVSTAPVNLASGDPINVSLIYNGSTLTETLRDSITSGTFSTTYLESLSSAIGSPTAFVGFTAATSDTFSGPNQVISNFQFNAVPEPSSLALLAAGGLGLLVIRRYRTRTT